MARENFNEKDVYPLNAFDQTREIANVSGNHRLLCPVISHLSPIGGNNPNVRQMDDPLLQKIG